MNAMVPERLDAYLQVPTPDIAYHRLLMINNEKTEQITALDFYSATLRKNQ